MEDAIDSFDGPLARGEALRNLGCKVADFPLLFRLDGFIIEAWENVGGMQTVQPLHLACDSAEMGSDLVLNVQPPRRKEIHFYHRVPIGVQVGHKPRALAIGVEGMVSFGRGVVGVGLTVGEVEVCSVAPGSESRRAGRHVEGGAVGRLDAAVTGIVDVVRRLPCCCSPWNRVHEERRWHAPPQRTPEL